MNQTPLLPRLPGAFANRCCLFAALGLTACHPEAVAPAPPSLVGTWTLESVRTVSTALTPEGTSTEHLNTAPYARVAFEATGTVTWYSSLYPAGAAGPYTLQGATLTYFYPNMSATTARVSALTPTRLVWVSTHESALFRSVSTVTATR